MGKLSERLPMSTLLYLFTELEMTDKAIAELFRVDRTTITHLRKDYGIPSRLTLGRQGELLALEKLRELGFAAVDMNETDKLADFDILANGSIRIDVKTGSMMKQDGAYHFTFSDHPANGNAAGKNRIVLPGGRLRKVYRNTCDILLFICWDEKIFYIVPSDVIPEKISGTSISKNSPSYKPYEENWNVIHAIHAIKQKQGEAVTLSK